MKQTIQNAALLLAVALPLAVQANPAGSGKSTSPQKPKDNKPKDNKPKNQQGGQGNKQNAAGNSQRTTYDFKGDTFGANDNLVFNTNTYATGGNAGGKRKTRRHLYVRDAEADGTLFSEDANIFARWAEPSPFMDGGSSKGGNSRAHSDNHNHQSNHASDVHIKGGGSMQQGNSNMQSSMGAQSGAGGGASGGGAGFNANLMLPLPIRKRGLINDDDLVELVARFAEAQPKKSANTHGGNSRASAGNYNSNANTIRGAQIAGGSTINLDSSSSQTGGSAMGGQGGGAAGGNRLGRRALDLDDDDLALALYARYAEADPFMNGGNSQGGNSHAHSDNHNSGHNHANGVHVSGGGGMSQGNANQQATQGAFSGPGGGAAGGSSSSGFGLSLFRRDDGRVALQARDLYAREIDALVNELVARFAEPEAEPEADPEADAEPEFEWDEYDMY